MINRLIEYSILKLSFKVPKYKRFLYETIDFNSKLIGIIGARGAGKTTMLLQYLKETDLKDDEKLYISCDHPLVAIKPLFDIAKEAYKYGIKLLVIDEIHKAKNFSIELKNIYDFLDIKILFTGSSAISLEKSKVDLSRRALIYNLPELSLREFINLKTSLDFRAFKLEEILNNHINIASSILKKIRPIKYFNEYLDYGAYPYFLEGVKSYNQRLIEIVNQTLREDIAIIYKVKLKNIEILQKILEIICSSEPYEINYEKIASMAKISKNTLKQYLYYLEKASLARRVGGKIGGNRYILKPDKLYLHNPNLFNILCDEAKIGTKREVFFASMLNFYNLTYPKKGDFLVNSKYLFEIGEKNKSFNQIKDIKNSFIASDNIEVGFGNKIPLWLFGFLYWYIHIFKLKKCKYMYIIYHQKQKMFISFG